MVKTNLDMEQIIAGALLLGSENVSKVDITLLAEDFLKKNPGYNLKELELDYLSKYVKIENGKISLKDNYVLGLYIPENDSTLEKRLEQIAGACIIKYLNNFDMEEFLLRKIEYYSVIHEDGIENLLCKKQQEKLKKLDDKGYLTTYWIEDAIYDDTKVTTLSQYGRLKLFKIDNSEDISRFVEELKSLRYDVSLLDDFLLKQDLELPIWNILNIENLEQFCNDYDRASLELGASKVYFDRLESKKRKHI